MPDALSSSASSSPKKASGVLVSRLVSTLLLWGMIFGALAFHLDWPLLLLICGFGLLGAVEYAGMQRQDPGSRPFMFLLLLMSLVWWVLFFLRGVNWRTTPINPAGETFPLWMDAGFLLLIVLISFSMILWKPLEGGVTLSRIFSVLFGFLYTASSFSFLGRTLFLPGTNEGAHLMLLTIAVVKFGDMGAYAFGSWLGRHKMVPHISPAKSWEGAGGAVIGSLVAAILMMIFDGANLAPLGWGSIFPFALALCTVGMLGDLAESVLKRCHGVKDSGHVLPGIGGILDLTDSLLFAAPVAYFCLRMI